MKKLPILMTLFLLSSSLFPASFLAADTEKNNNTQDATTSSKYNEFGIKKGTMLFGEDISKLSEEELQYIPEGWRDGVIEGDLHDHASEEAHSNAQAKAPAGSMSRAAAYQNVNDYIAKKKFTPAKTETNYKSVFPKMNYRKGYGKVEGVVAHETANDKSTITGEIKYMTNNYGNAFVHAFVDHERIIEIHPTNNSVWGAGKHGNARFVQVELVRVHSFDNFARSIDNYSTYIASVLYKYKLGVSSAEAKGVGTLWSHGAVTKFLGGTNHSDPHGYFAKYGYNWSEFTELVTSKYKKLAGNSTVTPVSAPKEIATSKMGQLKSSNAKVYSKLTSTTSKSAGTENLNTALYIKKEATKSGSKYYLIGTQPNVKSGLVGWVKAADINVQTHSTVDAKAKTFYIKGTGSAYKKPWGRSGDYFFKSLVVSKDREFKVNLTEKVGSTIWYRGVVNDRTVWIEAKNVSAAKQSATNKLGHIKNVSVKVYPDIDKLSSTISMKNYVGAVYYIKKEAKLNGVTYYLLSKNPSSTTGVLGWAKASDITMKTNPHVDKIAKTFYIKGTGSAYTKPWGGKKDFVYEKLSSYTNKEFKVSLTEKVGSTIWYRGVVNGKTAWIEAGNVTAAKYVATHKLGRFKNSSVKLFSNLENLSSTNTAKNYMDSVYYIKKEAVLKGVTYYMLSKNPSSTTGIVGWAKSTDVTMKTNPHVDKKAKTFYLKGSGSAYTKPWGGTKDYYYKSLTSSADREFKVNLTEKVGSTIWYRGVVNGKTVWIDANHVSAVKKTTTSKLGFPKSSNVKIYPDIDKLSVSQTAGATKYNSVFFIKKEAVVKGVKYYLLGQNASTTTNVIGWVKSTEVTVQTHATVDKKAKTFNIIGTGSSYTKAWGRSQNIVAQKLSVYKNKAFKVNLTEKVGNTVWYRGVVDGKTMWIQASYLKAK